MLKLKSYSAVFIFVLRNTKITNFFYLFRKICVRTIYRHFNARATRARAFAGKLALVISAIHFFVLKIFERKVQPF
jgi:hypothetical protein